MNAHPTVSVERWLYAVGCVLLPVAWGLAMVWVINRVERLVAHRRDRRGDSSTPCLEPPTVEYHI